jgi:hypothetical protein
VPASRPIPTPLGQPRDEPDPIDAFAPDVPVPVDEPFVAEAPSPVDEPFVPDVAAASETSAPAASTESTSPRPPRPARRSAWPDFDPPSVRPTLDDLLDDARARHVDRPQAPPREVPPPGDSARADVPGSAGFLRALFVPRIEALSQRLVIARHRTTLDDRLGESPPALRFRVEPWHGPFDDPEGRRGAVLEILADGPRPRTVAGRLWFDPLSKTPSEQREVAADALTDAWIDELLLDFVGKAFRRG